MGKLTQAIVGATIGFAAAGVFDEGAECLFEEFDDEELLLGVEDIIDEQTLEVQAAISDAVYDLDDDVLTIDELVIYEETGLW